MIYCLYSNGEYTHIYATTVGIDYPEIQYNHTRCNCNIKSITITVANFISAYEFWNINKFADLTLDQYINKLFGI